MPVELQGLSVLMQVEVGIAQLAVDGTEHLQVLCTHLDGSFKEGDASSVVPHLTETLTFQRQLQAGHLHPTADRRRLSCSRVKYKSALLFELAKPQEKNVLSTMSGSKVLYLEPKLRTKVREIVEN